MDATQKNKAFQGTTRKIEPSTLKAFHYMLQIKEQVFLNNKTVIIYKL